MTAQHIQAMQVQEGEYTLEDPETLPSIPEFNLQSNHDHIHTIAAPHVISKSWHALCTALLPIKDREKEREKDGNLLHLILTEATNVYRVHVWEAYRVFTLTLTHTLRLISGCLHVPTHSSGKGRENDRHTCTRIPTSTLPFKA